MKLEGDFPTILFSIETTTRELDSKLVMASALAAQGCRVLVGHKEVVQDIGRASSRVLWQGKSLFSSDQFADSLIKKGSAIMFLSDEGSMYPVKSWTQRVLKKHDLEHINQINRLCVWGIRQKNVISDHAEGLEDLITVTGSPRFDLCLSKFSWITEHKCEEIRSQYSPFILVCTRFKRSVHTEGQHNVFKVKNKKNGGVVDQTASIDLTFSEWQREVHDFADFIFMIKELAVQYSQYTIILRPHPCENIVFYEQAFASFKNVVVTRADNVLPWIRSAELVVHTNCTTGVEAVLADRPVLNLLPACEGRTDVDVEVAREAGSIAESIDEAVDKTQELLSGDAPRYLWSRHAQTMLHNLNHETVPILVAETIRVIKETKVTSSRVELPTERRFFKGRRLRESAITYVATKRRPLDSEYVEMVLEKCRSNHVGNGRIRKLTEEYVVVDPA